jgi:hypothetical protein
MTLGSNLFRGNKRLAACEVSNPAHVVTGDTGDHVRLIQIALGEIDGAEIAEAELKAKRYGPSTASAVLQYKRDREIINPAYQSKADNIVGKMTIVSLDKDMMSLQVTPSRALSKRCDRAAGAGTVPIKSIRRF